MREGGRKKTERIEDLHRAHLWAVPLIPSTVHIPDLLSTMVEPSLGKSLWLSDNSLSGTCRIRVTTGGMESYSTCYMRKANM